MRLLLILYSIHYAVYKQDYTCLRLRGATASLVLLLLNVDDIYISVLSVDRKTLQCASDIHLQYL